MIDSILSLFQKKTPIAPPIFSYIICYRHGDERYQNLIRVLEWLDGFNCEIIISEQDIEPHPALNSLFTSDKNVKRVFNSYSEKFNRSKCFNDGAKEASHSILVFGDGDLVMDESDLLAALTLFKTRKLHCISPYKKVIDLTEEELLLTFSDWKNIKRKPRPRTNLCGGVVAFTKKGFEKCGGWCEDFVGWGGEDNHMEYVVKKNISWKMAPYRIYHLYHEEVTLEKDSFNKNLDTLKDLTGINLKYTYIE